MGDAFSSGALERVLDGFDRAGLIEHRPHELLGDLLDLTGATWATLVDLQKVQAVGAAVGHATLSRVAPQDEADRETAAHAAEVPFWKLVFSPDPRNDTAFLYDLVTRDEFMGSDFYRTCGSRLGIRDIMGVAPRMQDGCGRRYALALLFSKAGEASERKRARLTGILPTIRRGLASMAMRHELEEKAAALELVADSVDEALVAVKNERIVTVNLAARRVLGLYNSPLSGLLSGIGPGALAAGDLQIVGANGLSYRVHAASAGTSGVRLLRLEPVIGGKTNIRRSAESASLKLGLSLREAQVFGLMAAGLSNSEIGQELSISFHTVRAYLRRVFARLGVESRVEALSAVLHRDANL